MSKLCIGEVGKFLWNGKSQLSLKLQFLTKGTTFFHLIILVMPYTCPMINFKIKHWFFYFYLIFINLIHFKSLIIQIKFKNQWNSVIWIWIASIYHVPAPKLMLGLGCTPSLGFAKKRESLLMVKDLRLILSWAWIKAS